MRLRFWLGAMDLANWLGWRRLYLWTVGRASDATDWGEAAVGEGEAF